MDDNILISRLSVHLLRSPARISILGFALLIAVGTALLMLPASVTGSPMGLVDALFMSTSATCVTGLSLFDIGQQLTLYGQLVILLLIQVGGLGIMTVSTLLLMMMKRRPTLSGQAIIKDTFTYGEGKQTVASVLRAVFITAIIIEAAGSLCLYLLTAPTAGWGQAAYPAVFHAVSDAQGRILRKIGADDIYFPEKDIALTAAQRLDNPNILDYLPFMEGYSIVELTPPMEFIGKTLIELDLINKHGIQMVAVKEQVPENVVMIPTGRYLVKDSDVLVLLGPDKALAGLKEKPN